MLFDIWKQEDNFGLFAKGKKSLFLFNLDNL